MSVRSPRQWNLCELAALAAAALTIIAVLLPTLGRARQQQKRTACVGNLSGIMKGMIAFSQGNNHIYPGVDNDSPKTYNVPFKPNSYGTPVEAADGVQSKQKGNPLASLWLLVLSSTLPPKTLICPEDPSVTGPAPVANEKDQILDDFSSEKSVSYSVAFPWIETDDKTVEIGRIWQGRNNTNFPLVSDMAPLAEPKADPPRDPRYLNQNALPKTYNSANHDFAGQEVGFGDGHSEWRTTPEASRFTSGQWDNIWTVQTKDGQDAIPGGGIGQPLTITGPRDYDIVMVPARDSSGHIK